MTTSTASALTGTFARLASALETMAARLARLEQVVTRVNARIEYATSAALEAEATADAVLSTIESALAIPDVEQAAPREEVLAALRVVDATDEVAIDPPANGTPTAEAPAPTLAPVVTIHPDGIATVEVPEGMGVEEAEATLDSAREEATGPEAEKPAPEGKRGRRRSR